MAKIAKDKGAGQRNDVNKKHTYAFSLNKLVIIKGAKSHLM